MAGPPGATADIAGVPVEDLAAFGILRPLPPEILAGLARSLLPERHGAGSTILARGDRPDRMHFLREGRVRVEILAPGEVRVPVAVLGPGDCFGEMSLLTGEPASADVIAEEETLTLALDRESFNRLAAESPGLLREFTSLISRRLRATGEAFVSSREKEQEVTRFLRDDGGEEAAAPVGRAGKDLDRRASEAAAGDGPVLLLGERGTGKEMLARRIHRASARSAGPLLCVDCNRISATQWGDSLFGDYHRKDGRPHPRGACTMDLVEGGTLLLRNIESLPPPVMERLGRYFRREGTGGVRRHDVRILATHRGAPGAEKDPRGPLRSLPPEITARTLAIPPLRERKRDIPDLARHFVARHAARMGLGPRRLDDQAVRLLVTHDFAHSNVAELEEAIRRALLLTDGEVVAAEAVFLVRPGAGSDRPRLHEIRRPLVRLALRAWPGAVRWAVAAFFAGLVAVCFLAPSTAGGRVSLVLIWALWWPALAISFLLLGRAWCSVCPMASAGAAAQRLSTSRRPVPAWLKEREPWLIAAGFFLILWLEEVTAMRASPVATGFLLLGILSGAVAASLLWPRRTWCRHLCPLGGLAGACSTTSMVEVRSTPDVCEAKCTGHACYKGTDAVPGCPMFHHLMFLDSNRDCVLCMNCVRACPNDSPRVFLRLPAEELWRDLRSRPEAGWIAALLVGLLPALSLAQSWEMVAVEPFTGWMHAHRAATLTALLAGMGGLPVLLLALRLRRGDVAPVWARLSSWLPLVAAGFAAYQAAFLPGISGLDTRVGWAPEEGAAETVLRSPVLPALQVAFLGVGLVLSMLIRLRQHPPGEEGRGAGAVVATAAGMAGPAAWFTAITALLVGTTTAAAAGPATLAILAGVVAISFRLSLGFGRR